MSVIDSGYTAIWEFEVEADAEEEFRREYGPGGSWVALFRRHPGYLDTLLLHDATRPGRYLTIDRWTSAAAYAAFRARAAAEYDALDRACERLTRGERSLGVFSQLSRP